MKGGSSLAEVECKKLCKDSLLTSNYSRRHMPQTLNLTVTGIIFLKSQWDVRLSRCRCVRWLIIFPRLATLESKGDYEDNACTQSILKTKCLKDKQVSYSVCGRRETESRSEIL